MLLFVGGYAAAIDSQMSPGLRCLDAAQPGSSMINTLIALHGFFKLMNSPITRSFIFWYSSTVATTRDIRTRDGVGGNGVLWGGASSVHASPLCFSSHLYKSNLSRFVFRIFPRSSQSLLPMARRFVSSFSFIPESPHQPSVFFFFLSSTHSTLSSGISLYFSIKKS